MAISPGRVRVAFCCVVEEPVTFPVVTFCADALLKSVSGIKVGGVIKLKIRAKTPKKII